MGYRIINGMAYPVGNFRDISNVNNRLNDKSTEKPSFKSVLENAVNKTQGYTLSKHASERLSEINFNQMDMEAIGKGFKIAEGKGSKNSVMIYKDVALIASIENKTVITAVEKERAKDNIFTNVDSVVIL